MAFGDRYETTTTSLRLGKTITATVAREGYTGTKNVLSDSDAIPMEVRWIGSDDDPFSPIVGSEAVLRLYSDVSYKFQEFFNISDRQYRLTIDIGGSTYWQGYIVPGIYNEVYESGQYVIDLVATCGLGDLYNQPFVDPSTSDQFTTTATVETYLEYIITDYIGLGLNINENANIFHSSHTTAADTDSFFDQTNLAGHAFREINVPVSCGEVLENILRSLGCRIYQSEGEWRIEKIDLIDTDHVVRNTTSTWGGVTAKKINPVLILQGDSSVTSGDIIPLGNSGDVTIREGSEPVIMDHDYGPIDDVLLGVNFDDDQFPASDQCDFWISNYSGAPALWTGFNSWSSGNKATISKQTVDEATVMRISGDSDETFVISAMASHASGTTITCTGHTYSNNEYVHIVDQANDDDFNKDYAGFYQISNVASNTFVISATFTSDRSSATTKARRYQNSTLVQQQLKPNGIDGTITEATGQYMELDISYIVNRTSGSNASDSYSHVLVLIGLDNQSGGSDLYATNNEYATISRDSTILNTIAGFDGYFQTSAWKPILIPVTDLDTVQSTSLKIGLNLNGTDTYTPYLAIGQAYGNDNAVTSLDIVDVNLAVKGTKVRIPTIYRVNSPRGTSRATRNGSPDEVSGAWYLKRQGILAREEGYTGPGVLSKSTGFQDSKGRDISTVIPIGAVDQDKNYEWKVNRIWLDTSDDPLDNTSSSWTDGTKTDVFDEVIAEPYKLAYKSNAIRLRLELEENDFRTIEFYNCIQDNMTFGRRFMITSLTKNLKDNTAGVGLLELKPREDIMRNLSVSVDATFEPEHFIGPPSDIEGIVSLNSPFTGEDDAWAAANNQTLLFDSNNVPYITTSGSDNPFVVTSTYWNRSQPLTVMIALRCNEAPATDRVIFNSNNGTTNSTMIKQNNGDIYLDAGTSVDTTANITTDKLEVWTAVFNGASSNFYYDKNTAGSVSAGVEPMTGISLLADNLTSAIAALDYDFYGCYIWNSVLSTADREAAVDALRAKTQADKIGITAEIKNQTRDVLDFTFDRSVTGFTTAGLSLVYKSTTGTERTIQAGTQTGSGTAWEVDLSGDVTPGDEIYLLVDEDNPATTTAGDRIYPGYYSIRTPDNPAYRQFAQYLGEYDPYEVVDSTPGTVDQFVDISGNGNNAVLFSGDTKVTVSTDGNGVKYCNVTAATDSRYKITRVQNQPHTVTMAVKFNATAQNIGYLFDGDSVSDRAAIWRNDTTNDVYAFAGTTLQAGATLNETTIMTITVVFDGSSSSIYVDGVEVASEQNVGADDVGSFLTLLGRFDTAVASADFDFYKCILFNGDIGAAQALTLHNELVDILGI